MLSRSLRKMEKTLETVLRSFGNQSLASAMISRSPSPSQASQTHTTQALLGSPSPPHSPPRIAPHDPLLSPKLHSLPDNALNPLGLLAEASLANRRAQAVIRADITPTIPSDQQDRKLGVASASYFKPGKHPCTLKFTSCVYLIISQGPMTILPLRRLFIERQVQPEMLSFVSNEEVIALFRM